MKYDRIIIGAGIYGLYAAYKSGQAGYKTLLLEADNSAGSRGTYVNQARLHSGYHYPRSRDTAEKSRDYFFRFMNDFSSAIYTDFTQLYAIAHNGSLTTAEQFEKFCDDLSIKCDSVSVDDYFKPRMVDALYDTLEYAIDNKEVVRLLLSRMNDNVTIKYNYPVTDIQYSNGQYTVNNSYIAPWVLNATYGSTNQVLALLNLPLLDIKYELCEVILCEVSENIKHVGLTVMDGPFFSIMPFGNTGLHSLTSVSHTPHTTSYDSVPTYACQSSRNMCGAEHLCNCNQCKYAPKSSSSMLKLAQKYLKDDISITPVQSLYAVKPILNSCEKTDARPTLIQSYEQYPNFYTVFSGKLNTIYDLDEVLQ